MLGQQVHHPSEHCVFPWLQKFIEYQHAAARFQYPRCFFQAGAGIRYDRQNEVQHHVVEAGVHERQRHAVPLDKVYMQVSYPGSCPLQHGRGKVQSYIMMTRWNMRKVEPCTDAADENIEVLLARQLLKAGRPQSRTRSGEQGIVKWSDQTVGTAQRHTKLSIL